MDGHNLSYIIIYLWLSAMGRKLGVFLFSFILCFAHDDENDIYPWKCPVWTGLNHTKPLPKHAYFSQVTSRLAMTSRLKRAGHHLYGTEQNYVIKNAALGHVRKNQDNARTWTSPVPPCRGKSIVALLNRQFGHITAVERVSIDSFIQFI